MPDINNTPDEITPLDAIEEQVEENEILNDEEPEDAISYDDPEAAVEGVQKSGIAIVDYSDITAKTVFLLVRFGNIGNTRKVSGSGVLTTDADVSLLRVSKTLLESGELEAIRKHDTKLRKYLANTCLPYDMGGVMLLPMGLVVQANAKLKEHLEERNVLVDTFITAYPSIKEKAKEQLGTLYVESDYPTAEELKSKFYFQWRLFTFEVPGQLAAIDVELAQQEQEKAAATIQEAAKEIVQVMRITLYEMVDHLKERLTPGADGKPKVLRESAIEKLKDFLNNFDLRNVTNDKALAQEVEKAKALLSSTTASTLRTSDEWREKIRKGMENITDSLGELVQDRPARKFKEFNGSAAIG